MTLPQIIQTYLAACNRRDVPALVECVADDVVFEKVFSAGSRMRIEGRVAFAELARQAAGIFVDRHHAVRTAVVDGIALRWKLNGRERRASISGRYAGR